MLDFGFATITHHQGATVCSYVTEAELSLPQAEAAVANVMEKTCALCDSRGGLVGHVKAFLQSQDACLTLSTTGGEISRVSGMAEEKGEAGITAITFTAIVFLMEDRVLRDFVEDCFQEIEE